MNIGITFAFMILGYLVGSLSTSIIISKIKGQDVRESGSGNAGATNTMRRFGKKTAFFVFLIDVLKPSIIILIAFLTVNEYVFLPLIALTTTIGHIWPIFFKFKGGKGSASIVGLVLAMQWILVIIGIIIFFAIVLKTRKVSLGSIFAPLLLIFIQIAFCFIPHMRDAWSEPITNQYEWWKNTLVFLAVWLITIYKHKDNIKRLLKGQERTIDQKNS